MRERTIPLPRGGDSLCPCKGKQKGFGNFLFSKFFGNSIDEIVVGRGSNRI